MDNSFSKAMENVIGAIWSQLMLKGRAEIAVNGQSVTTFTLDARTESKPSATGGKSQFSTVPPSASGPEASRPSSSMAPPPPPPPPSMTSYRSGLAPVPPSPDVAEKL